MEDGKKNSTENVNTILNVDNINITSLYDMDFSPKSDHKYLQFEISNE